MAAFAFPIFNHPSIMLVLIALAACFVGRYGPNPKPNPSPNPNPNPNPQP